MSQRIQKKIEKERKRERQKGRKRREGRHSARNEPQKKRSLLAVFFLLVRFIFSLQVGVEIVVQLLIYIRRHHRVTSFFLKKKYISNADDSSLNYSFIEFIDVTKPTTKFDDLVGFFCDYSR